MEIKKTTVKLIKKSELHAGIVALYESGVLVCRIRSKLKTNYSAIYQALTDAGIDRRTYVEKRELNFYKPKTEPVDLLV